VKRPPALFASAVLLLVPQGAPNAPRPAFELVESAPIETSLDHPAIRNADVVWVELIDAAKRSLDFGEFYASDQAGSRLSKVVEALERAAERGVAVRFLVDQKFTSAYPETIERLKRAKGAAVRVLDLSSTTRGVLHAKYFVVDGETVYLGSQNFDWRSLEHIQELGVRLAQPDVARAVQAVFELDWRAAGGEKIDWKSAPAIAGSFPVRVGEGADAVLVTPVFSPEPMLPPGAAWDLPKLVEWIDAAKESVRVQLLTYRAKSRDGGEFAELEGALRRAAARGVKVQLLCADWCKRKGTIEGLQALEPLDHLEVRLATIPPWSGGFIPFARVCHAKYCVIDGTRAWIGTSNWERDYFSASRNLGLLIEGASVGGELERFFASLWDSPYCAAVDPKAVYEPPRVDK
jgi:phosphatidylserine/phosphatidylglycerophosphate/cardiolipin synthase-like enzyme